MSNSKSVNSATPIIGGISYVFPESTQSVQRLEDESQLQSTPRTLESFGFANVHVGIEESPYQLARDAVAKLMTEQAIDPESVGLVIYGGTPGVMAFSPAGDAAIGAAGFCTTDRFKYPSARLQYDLGLSKAWAFGIDQMACTTLLGATRIARSLCMTEGIERAICVAS
ncbi:MAG TPA: hypothetical protein VGL17_14205, partial [Gemmatimonadaceae bacterium]